MYIINPETNKKVKVDGVLGRKIIQKYINIVGGGKNQPASGGGSPHNNTAEICTICLDPLENGKPIEPYPFCPGIKHIFHQDCMALWKEKKGRQAPCPVCKASPPTRSPAARGAFRALLEGAPSERNIVWRQ